MVVISIIVRAMVRGTTMPCYHNTVLVCMIEKREPPEPLHLDMDLRLHQSYLKMENGWYMDLVTKIKLDWLKEI